MELRSAPPESSVVVYPASIQATTADTHLPPLVRTSLR